MICLHSYSSGLRACERIVASEARSRSAGAQEPECMLKYMRIPSTAGTRDPERSRFFHKLWSRFHLTHTLLLPRVP